jgi:hypothetical protein
MGDGTYHTDTMMRLLHLIAVVSMLSGCGKEVDTASLNNNPFDPDYSGPSVYELDTTYVTTTVINGVPLSLQTIAFMVKEELLLSDVAYSVQVKDIAEDFITVVDPNPPNSNHFTYSRPAAMVGVPVCLELRLYNNLSAARADRLCATLQ